MAICPPWGGQVLHAKQIFNFSGQWNLYTHEDVLATYPMLKKYGDDTSRNKFFDLRVILQGEQGPQINYFMPAYSDQDVKQSRMVDGLAQVLTFSFASSVHGATVVPQTLPVILTSSPEQLRIWQQMFQGRIIRPYAFLWQTTSIAWMIRYVFLHGGKKICRKLRGR